MTNFGGKVVLLILISTICCIAAKSKSKKPKAGEPKWTKFDIKRCGSDIPRMGKGPPNKCKPMIDPQKRPKSPLEKWFTKKMFNSLFPFANNGWGPHDCFPYNYKSLMIAARYFPEFGTSNPPNGLSKQDNYGRDLAIFFGNSIQETGMNIAGFFQRLSPKLAEDCFFRGGLYAWYENGMTGGDGSNLKDGETGKNPYCDSTSKRYPCMPGAFYYGRGAYQLSYNYNYGQFQEWLAEQGINVDLLSHPNLIMTKRDPPLAMMASLWFHMTAQPPKPAMHDIILGQWNAGKLNEKAGYYGPISGPCGLIINGECQGYDPDPTVGQESRRIHAFHFFAEKLNVTIGKPSTWSCKNMPQKLNEIPHNTRYRDEWKDMHIKGVKCKCKPAPGQDPEQTYYDPKYYPRFAKYNKRNMKACLKRVALSGDYTCKMPSSVLKGIKRKTE